MMKTHFGAYLPAWHPWEDYKESYAARKDLGGGARRTHIHELDYIYWLMGPIEKTVVLDAGINPLETDVDELTSYVLRHKSGALSSLTLSLAQTPPSRTIEISFTRGVISVDLVDGSWTVCQHDGTVTTGRPPEDFDLDHTYRDQAIDFMKAINGEIPIPVPLSEAKDILSIALTEME